VALLKTLVRDIEEAAQAVSGGMVGQRDAIAMAAGGHPQLVEAVSLCVNVVFPYGQKNDGGQTFPHAANLILVINLHVS